MNYAELSVAQHHRAKEFSKAQTDAMAAYCDAEHDLRELQVENAKLRELVRDLYKDLAAILGDGLWMEPYESEMMELGVDFDG